jgi:hypothetical protein
VDRKTRIEAAEKSMRIMYRSRSRAAVISILTNIDGPDLVIARIPSVVPLDKIISMH